ncbi:MAG: DDE-type integrase/transposase/recombinase [Oscillospiraceae bacterium]|nr:DDE-type integrase/transposase/recombinase [Oscillospiraceae bacterium]
MNHEKKQAIALMRYSAIAPLITGTTDDYGSQSAYFRAASAKGIKAPDGTLRHYSPGTLEKWYHAYKRSGFDALVPSGRSDCGTSRKIDDDLKEQISYLKHHYPRMSAAAIYKQLQDNGSIRSGQISESTVCRFINQLMLQERLTNNQDMRRYERPHINEVWCGDSSAGPYLKTTDGRKHRVYVIALIDDASRFVLAADVFFNDTFVNLMSVMKSAVSKYGKPAVFNFDNGAAYKNKQMELLAARIGSVISYCRPYTPTQKAKIERWFRTLKDQWMASLDMKDFHSLEELRGSLLTYIRSYNQRSHSSLKGLSPQERFFQEPELICRLPDEQVETSFLLEVERRVSADSVVVIDQVEYEVDYRFARQRVTLRYTPDMTDIFVVETDGNLTPVRLLNKQENALVKRDKVRLTGGDESWN